MKTRSKMPALASRQGASTGEINIQGYPVFSSRENFYSQYNKQKTTKRKASPGKEGLTPARFVGSLNKTCAKYSESVTPGMDCLSDFEEFIEFAISDDEENRFYNSREGEYS